MSKAVFDQTTFDASVFDVIVVNIENIPGVYNFGMLIAGAVSATGLDYFEITNNSAFAIDIYIRGTDMTGGNGWLLANDGVAGSDIVAIKAGLGGGSYNVIVKKDEPYNLLTETLGPADSILWGLQMSAPTVFSDGVEKTGTVTVIGVAS